MTEFVTFNTFLQIAPEYIDPPGHFFMTFCVARTFNMLTCDATHLNREINRLKLFDLGTKRYLGRRDPIIGSRG